MLLGGDEIGRTQQRQQQRLLPGQRDLLVRLGPGARDNLTLLAFTRAARSPLRRAPPGVPAPPVLQGRPIHGGTCRHRLVRPRRRRDDREHWNAGFAKCVGDVPQRRRDRRGPARAASAIADDSFLVLLNAARQRRRVHAARRRATASAGASCSTPTEPELAEGARSYEAGATRLVEHRRAGAHARVTACSRPRVRDRPVAPPTGSSSTPAFGFADAAGDRRRTSPTWDQLTSTSRRSCRRGAVSTHGYDVVDHGRVSAELGGERGLRAAGRRAAQARGLGLVVDVVPNHCRHRPGHPMVVEAAADGQSGDAAAGSTSTGTRRCRARRARWSCRCSTSRTATR